MFKEIEEKIIKHCESQKTFNKLAREYMFMVF